MLTVWYFDGDPIGSAPEHIVTDANSIWGADNALAALQERFGYDLFINFGPFDTELRSAGAGFVWELPADSRLVVIKH